MKFHYACCQLTGLWAVALFTGVVGCAAKSACASTSLLAINVPASRRRSGMSSSIGEARM